MAISSLTLAFVGGVKRRGAPYPAPHIFRFNSHPSFWAGHAGYVNNDDLEYHRILLLRETQEKSFKFRETGGGVVVTTITRSPLPGKLRGSKVRTT